MRVCAVVLIALVTISVGAEPRLAVVRGFEAGGAPTATWRAMVQKKRGSNVALSPKPLTPSESAWVALIESRVSAWTAELARLREPFEPVQGPPLATIVVGNQGAEDAFTHDNTTIGFDAARLLSAYGDASLPENHRRIDRFFRHEYTHLLQKAWLARTPYAANDPLRLALAEIWAEGLGNYYSLSDRWRSGSETAQQALKTLSPRFVARLAALSCASPEQAAALTADLSQGRFDQKWGALPVALWLETEASRSPDALRRFVSAGPDGIWNLADRHLPEHLGAALREARAAWQSGGGATLALSSLMSHENGQPEEPRFIEEQGATEEQNEKIDAIVGDEVLGYDGSGRGEHSGQESEPGEERITDALANNRPEQIK